MMTIHTQERLDEWVGWWESGQLVGTAQLFVIQVAMVDIIIYFVCVVNWLSVHVTFIKV